MKGDIYAWKVYELTGKFPKHELYGMISQLRRAVLFISLNIVDSYARNNRNEFKNFLRISLGSLAETEYLLHFSLRREYITQKEYETVIELKDECGKILWKLMKSMG